MNWTPSKRSIVLLIYFRFTFDEISDVYTDRRFAAEQSAEFAVHHAIDRCIVAVPRQRYVFYLIDELSSLQKVESYELSSFRAIQRSIVDIEEQGTGQRLVSATLDGLRGGCDRPFSCVNGDRSQFLLIFHVVGVAKVTDPVAIVGDSLSQNIIVFAGGKVTAARLSFTDDGFGEVVEGAGISAGAE